MATDRLPDPSFTIHDVDFRSSTVKVRVKPDSFYNISRALRRYKALPLYFRPALEQLGDYVRTTMIPRTFEQEGPGWERLAPKTIGQRIRDGFPPDHPILIQTGDLYAELTEKSHPKHIEIIKVGQMARIEIGGSSAKFIENQTGTGLPNLPARPMIPGTGWLQLPDGDRKEMHRILERAMFNRMRR